MADSTTNSIPVQPDAERLKNRIVSIGSRDWSTLGSILSNVAPATLKAIFADADNGYPGRQVELAQDLRERDDHLGDVDQIRRAAVAGLEWIVEPGDDSEPAKLAADAFREAWEALEPHAIIDRMQDAVLEQWAIQEVIWDTDGTLSGKRFWRPTAIEEVDGRKIVWPYQRTTEAGDITEITPRIEQNWSASGAVATEPGKFLSHSHKARRGRPGRGCLIRACAWLWMFKRFSIIDLASLLEQWGRPWPVIKYDAKATTEQVREWLLTLADSMADRAMAVPVGSEIEVKPAGAGGADTPHLEMIKLCNEGFSKIMVGSTTIAEAAGDSKSVSSPTHASVREDIRNSDARSAASSIRRCLAEPFVIWNFGPNVAVPTLRANLSPKPDPSSRADVYVKAAALGLRVKSEQLYRELSIEAPADVEETIQLSAANNQPSTEGWGTGADGWPIADGGLQTPAPKPAADAVPVAPTDVAQDVNVLPGLVLNGAQIQAALAIVTGVASGEMPRDAGIGQLQVLFNLTAEQAEQIMGSAGTDVPTTPNPRPMDAAPGR